MLQCYIKPSIAIGSPEWKVWAKRASILHASADRGEGQQLDPQARYARTLGGNALNPVGVEQRWRGGAADQRHMGRKGVAGQPAFKAVVGFQKLVLGGRDLRVVGIVAQ